MTLRGERGGALWAVAAPGTLQRLFTKLWTARRAPAASGMGCRRRRRLLAACSRRHLLIQPAVSDCTAGWSA